MYCLSWLWNIKRTDDTETPRRLPGLPSAGEHSLDNELALRGARMGSLRELDKAAEASRGTRGEGFPPDERLALHEAMAELEIALSLDPEDYMLWNFKSAWL